MRSSLFCMSSSHRDTPLLLTTFLLYMTYLPHEIFTCIVGGKLRGLGLRQFSSRQDDARQNVILYAWFLQFLGRNPFFPLLALRDFIAVRRFVFSDNFLLHKDTPTVR